MVVRIVCRVVWLSARARRVGDGVVGYSFDWIFMLIWSVRIFFKNVKVGNFMDFRCTGWSLLFCLVDSRLLLFVCFIFFVYVVRMEMVC